MHVIFLQASIMLGKRWVNVCSKVTSLVTTFISAVCYVVLKSKDLFSVKNFIFKTPAMHELLYYFFLVPNRLFDHESHKTLGARSKARQRKMHQFSNLTLFRNHGRMTQPFFVKHVLDIFDFTACFL